MQLADEVVAPFDVTRSQTPVATHFRSTWLTSSIRSVRELGLLDAYLAHLPKEHHAAVLDAVAGVWLPIDVAIAHYAACDALPLDMHQRVAIGRAVTVMNHRTAYGLAIRLAKQAGVTPWTCFGLNKRLWVQVWRGGDVATFKTGPKEARVEIAGWPCSRFEYVRHAMQGVLLGQTELFCSKAYVHAVAALCGPTTLAYRVAWA